VPPSPGRRDTGCFKERGEAGRQGGDDYPAAGEIKDGGVQEKAFESNRFFERPVEGKIPVFVVPKKRKAQAGKMPPYLVGSAGSRLQFHQGTGDGPGAGRDAASRKERIPCFGGLWFPPDGKISGYAAFPAGGAAGADSEVLLFYAAFPEKPCVFGGGLGGFGGKDDSGGFPVKPVEQAGGGAPGFGQEGVQRRSYSCPALHGKAGRFVKRE
jgi:hypothetical protein